MSRFLTRHSEAVACLLIWFAGLAFTHGVNSAKLDQIEQTLVEIKSSQQGHAEAIAEIKTDIRWVKEQKK